MINPATASSCVAVKESASVFSCSSKLRNAFKSEMEITVGDYIDQFYFSRKFKQRYGMTPSQYRKQLQAERTQKTDSSLRSE